ncbi:MAG: DUF362 domain-containing protein [Armatimonadota bacterium]
MAKVYFKPVNNYKTRRRELADLIDKSNIFADIKEGGYVAVKLHLGEIDNPNYINPMLAGVVVQKIKEKGGIPFLTDTSTLYLHQRHDAVKHISTALKHGFTYFAVGAPFIQADGLGFEEGVKLNSPGLLKETYMASILDESDFLVVLTHCKGHDLASYGGAIKNIGMGCGTKKTKLAVHRLVNFEVDENKCIGCGKCVTSCPGHYPKIIDKKMVNDNPLCMRCLICSESCPEKAINLPNISDMQKGLASATKAVLDNFKEKSAFINLGIDISHSCDCLGAPGNMISPDIGYFASNDIVAVDKAFIDKCGADIFEKELKINPLIQIEEAEKLGAGSSKYELIET